MLPDQDDLVFRARGFIPQDGEISAYPLGAVAIVAFVGFYGARRFSVQSLGVEGCRDIARAVQRLGAIGSHFVEAEDEVYLGGTV